jgi:hypothetical protein
MGLPTCPEVGAVSTSWHRHELYRHIDRAKGCFHSNGLLIWHGIIRVAVQ